MAMRNGNFGRPGNKQNNYLKPESLAKRAEELLNIGKQEDAFLELDQVFSSQKLKQMPVASAEPIVFKFITLAVQLRKVQPLKDNLTTYKNMVQNSSVASIEAVVQHYIDSAQAKFAEAKLKCDALHPEQKAKEASTSASDATRDANMIVSSEGVEEDTFQTPESILMSAVSSEQSRDRSERAIVSPWLRFLFQVYRSVLDLLKNNSRLEIIYSHVVQQAFHFCKENDLKNDFRRLCEDISKHLNDIGKAYHNAVNLLDVETLQRYLDTRFLQLDISVSLNLWGQAFRTTEEIQNLLMLAKKTPKPSMMCAYYERLAQIFLVGDNGLFHAAALSKFYATAQHLPKTDEAPSSDRATELLLAVLAVPIISGEESKLKSNRLNPLLGLANAPARSELISEAVSRGVLKHVDEDVLKIFNILEVDFSPLKICATAAPILIKIQNDEALSKYVKPLLQVILTRFFQHLGQVYESIQMAQVLLLIEPLGRVQVGDINMSDGGAALTEGDIENFLMRACLAKILSARIDHVCKCITFKDDVITGSAAAAEKSDLDWQDGISVQSSSSEIARTQLQKLALTLQRALCTINPSATFDHASLWKTALDQAEIERQLMIARRAIARHRKESLAKMAAQRERESIEARRELVALQEEEEKKQALRDIKKRESERIAREIEATRRKEAEDLARTLNMNLKPEEIKDLDKDKLIEIQVEQLKKSNRDLDERLRIIFKRTDHLERAFRKTEKPLLAEDYKSQMIADREAHKRTIAQAKIDAVERHKSDMQVKERLARIVDDYQTVRQKMESQRAKEFADRRAAAESKIAKLKSQYREKVLAERAESARKAEEESRLEMERQELLRSRAEAEARDAVEAERLRIELEAKEQEAAIEKAELEAKAREERKLKQDALNEAARIQAAKEREIEERLEAQRRGGVRPRINVDPPAASFTGIRPNIPVKAGTWREREAEKKAAAAAAAGITSPPMPTSRPTSTQYPTQTSAGSSEGAYKVKTWSKKTT